MPVSDISDIHNFSSTEYGWIWDERKDLQNTRCVNASGDFKNGMNSKCFHLFSFYTYERNAYIKKNLVFVNFNLTHLTFNTLKTKVLLSENNINQMTTIPF